MTATLYWLTQDLRLDDNPALIRAANSDRLLCVYCVDPHSFMPYRYHVSALGQHRWRFLQEGLSALSERLEALGQALHIACGQPDQTLAALVKSRRITRLVCSQPFGSYEASILPALQRLFPALRIEVVNTYTLFDRDSLLQPLESLRKGFTPLRHWAELMPVTGPVQAPKSLPPPPLSVVGSPEALPEWLPSVQPRGASPFQGGEVAAQAQLDDYFSSPAPQSYKDTRNALMGWNASSKFSPWLSQGSLSVRRLRQRLRDYETAQGSNDSTYWLFFELLWREYFQWLALYAGRRLFNYKGIANKSGRTCVHPERYQKWCHGNTPYALVNACMLELKATGYLSNRGRQIAASCFVNELGLDWRYGAAWFEHQLLDYDVASNWGNWQYIAGVGVDPRGGRHFNLDQQAESYDPDGSYRARWAPEPVLAQLDSTDAADWPIEP